MGDVSPSTFWYLELLPLSASSAAHARRTLTDRGQIEKAGRTAVQVIDALFADWVCRRFPI
ncbi:MAG: hypothetical protein GXP35_06715 [Actinobacteria bacterium]|nr:hypothetical protein [Actinomycetota bacterium]